MLRRLRRQMVLLNALISGAILLTMALVALNVSESMLERQYERDLAQNADALLSTMRDSGAAVRVQFGANYSVYYRNGDQKQLISTALVDSVALERVASQAQTVLAVRLGQDSADASIADGTEMQVQRYYSVSAYVGEEEQGSSQGASSGVHFFQERLLFNIPNLLVSDGEKSYRASVTASTGQPVQQLVILQDRADELASVARLRWLFFGCVLGGLLLIGCASLYLSTRSIRPVERSLRQQRDFVAAASHELRTPVAAVRANAEVLADAPLGDFAAYRDAIAQESERMSRLVSDLIDLARADAGELQVREEPVDCAEVARRTLALLSPLAAQKEIALSSALDSAPCKADPDRLCQVLVALLDNAIRYAPAGGRVHITTEKSGAHAVIRVADDGPGIPDEHKEQVFERFFRMDAARSDGGCGLGLSVARQLAERMRGTISLEDAEGGGCAFTVRLK